MTEFTYINSVNITVARKIVDFAFGKANVFKIVKNDEEWTFDIFLTDEALRDIDTVKYFQEFWGKRYRLFRSTNELVIPDNNGQLSP